MSDEGQSDIGEFVAQSKSNAISIREMREEFVQGIAAIRQGMDKLSDRITTATAPSFSTFIAFACMILTIIGMVAAPIGFFYWNAIIGLDTKLQKEYQLSIQTTTQGIANLDAISKERHDSAIEYAKTNTARLEELERWRDDQLKADLEELRQRRMQRTQ